MLLPLRQRYSSLASANVSSFVDVINVSAKFLKTNAIKTAGAHAAKYYQSHPRMNLSKIRYDEIQAEAMGLLSFLTERSELLRGITIQPTGPLEPDLDPEIISMPPRPPADTLPHFHALCDGASLIIPPGFEPDGCPMSARKSAEYELAVEYIHQKDHIAGLSIVLSHATACRLFNQACLPINGTPTDIVAATDKPEGRLVVDVTRSRLNHLDKKSTIIRSTWSYHLSTTRALVQAFRFGYQAVPWRTTVHVQSRFRTVVQTCSFESTPSWPACHDFPYRRCSIRGYTLGWSIRLPRV